MRSILERRVAGNGRIETEGLESGLVLQSNRNVPEQREGRMYAKSLV